MTADRIRVAIDSVFAQPAYQWRDAADPWAPARRAWFALQEWIARLRADNPVAYRVLLWSLVAVLAAIVVHALWVAARTIRGGTAASALDSVERPPAPRDAAWYGDEAARLAREGRFAEAMQADFVRLTVELDGRRAVRYHPSRTPHEYVADPGLGEMGRREMHGLVALLYSHAFGGVPGDRAAWDAWRERAVPERYARAH